MRITSLAAACLTILAATGCPPADPCELDPDQDRDGHRSYECGGDDCDDIDARRYPGAVEVCDSADLDEDCAPMTFGLRDADADGSVDMLCANLGEDGSVARGDDCDDSNPGVHPGLAEVCDGRDNDCDGFVDDGVQATLYADADLDGYGDPDADTLQACFPPPGYSFAGSDCDDTRDDVHPGATELCDGRDNNCDGDTDEDATMILYVDADDDGFGAGAAVDGCDAGPGYSVRSGDCDDANAALVNGSMRCVDGSHYETCEDGAWSAGATCPTQQCQAQPNGTGVCI